MNKRLFVAGLPFSTTQDELRTLFSTYGNVVSASVITDRETGRSKGFGFVEMETEEGATSAAQALQGSIYGGRSLVVNEAKPREERSDDRRSFGRGGFGGGNRGGGFRGRENFGRRREGGRGNFGRSSQRRDY